MIRGDLICLDIEATGLDLDNDDIIEVAAVRFNADNILEQFHTLIDPQVPIPARITTLTGISDADVTGKPTMRAVRADLKAFIGDAPIVGHKVNYDVTLLQAHGIAEHNTLIDTYELASFLLPTAARYSLGSLVEQLELSDLNAHRALDDVLATIELYRELWRRALLLPLNVLQEIAHAARELDWQALPVVQEALRVRAKDALDEKISSRRPLAFQQGPAKKFWDSITIDHEHEPVEVDELTAMIEPDGLMSEQIPNYESRPSQVKMLARVAKALNNSEHVMIEAPTGTGKSLAYLIPAIAYSTHNNSRVVISTATLALQDQIMEKDVPLLQESLGVRFSAAVAKGRNNYLCPRQLAAQRRRHPRSVDELRVLAKVLVWLETSTTGDKSEINLRGFAEDMAWMKLSAQDEGCNLHRCENEMDGICPFYNARQKAEAANIVVANHALLLSDVQMGSRVLPNYRCLVIDEAHHLEDATTRGLQTRLDQTTIRRRFSDLGGTSKGVFGEILASTQPEIEEDAFEELKQFVQKSAEHVATINEGVGVLFANITTYLDTTGQIKENGYSAAVRILPNSRQTSEWAAVVKTWGELSSTLKLLASTVWKLRNRLDNIYDSDVEIERLNEFINTLQATRRDIDELNAQLHQFVEEPEDNMIYWCNVSANSNYMSLNIAPLHVGPLVREHLWEAKDTVILTSATIRTQRSFNFIRERLSAEKGSVAELAVPSPFDYEASTLIFIPTDIPEPSDRQNYQTMLERGLIEAATVADGRLLGLFTSYVQLQKTAQNIGPRLALGGISVLDQASGSSRRLLVESFKSLDKAVLLGTRSFWEGIDLPGDDLQVLAIARLPFSVPSDPVFAARAETFDNSFIEYSVPDAILRFRQGFGRLIRRGTDRGVVAIFDKRVISKRYGQHFLESLPKCTVVRAPLGTLADTTRRWLDR
jgi:ATP-dependent DNA helicase DinG